MEDILYRAASYLLVILLGVILKKIGFFKDSDFRTLAKVLLNLTLPCAIIYTFSSIVFEVSLLSITLFSFTCGAGMILITILQDHLIGAKKHLPFDIVNMSGYNIGNFCLPFAQNFLAPLSVLAISLFDMGNTVYCNGASKAVGEVFKHLNNDDSSQGQSISAQLRESLRTIFRALSHSVPLITYLILLFMLIFKLPIPKIVVSVASLGANANAFVAMLMIGVGFKLKIKKDGMTHILRILCTRYAITISMALLSYFVLPYALEIRQALVLAFLSPIASAAPAYTELLGEDFELSSTVNSLSMLISIALITLSLLLLL